MEDSSYLEMCELFKSLVRLVRKILAKSLNALHELRFQELFPKFGLKRSLTVLVHSSIVVIILFIYTVIVGHFLSGCTDNYYV